MGIINNYKQVVDLLDLGMSEDETVEALSGEPEHRVRDLYTQVSNSPAYGRDQSERVKKLCLLGLDDKRITEYLGVTITIYNMWKEVHTEFKEAITEGRERADGIVAEALLKLAEGYEEEDTKIFCYLGEIIEHEYTKKFQPNLQAIKLWLQARHSGTWKESSVVDLMVESKASKLSDDELDKLIARAGLSKRSSVLDELEEVHDEHD